jgi:hydrogenase-4 component E
MDALLNAVLVVVVLLNFLALGSSRMGAVIRTAALQGVLLGLMPLLLVQPPGWRVIVVCLAAVAIKGALIPFLLFRAMREVHIRREVEPLLGFIPSLLLGALGTGLAALFTSTLPMLAGQDLPLLLSTSFSTLMTGFIVLTTRRRAITQVVGYLILENGIYIFGLLLLDAIPFLVEMGMLLDLFVGVFVMGILLNQIQQTFSSTDTTLLSALKE